MYGSKDRSINRPTERPTDQPTKTTCKPSEKKGKVRENHLKRSLFFFNNNHYITLSCLRERAIFFREWPRSPTFSKKKNRNRKRKLGRHWPSINFDYHSPLISMVRVVVFFLFHEIFTQCFFLVEFVCWKYYYLEHWSLCSIVIYHNKMVGKMLIQKGRWHIHSYSFRCSTVGQLKFDRIFFFEWMNERIELMYLYLENLTNWSLNDGHKKTLTCYLLKVFEFRFFFCPISNHEHNMPCHFFSFHFIQFLFFYFVFDYYWSQVVIDRRLMWL